MASGTTVLLDTDMGPDCDDAGALALLNGLADRGQARILGVTLCTSSEYGAGCIDAINHFYGRTDIPVGRLARSGFLTGGVNEKYNRHIAEFFPNRFTGGSSAPPALAVTRTLLTQQPDGSVTVVAIGPLGNLADLLDSGPDQLVPVDGVSLVQAKVRRLVTMSCRFDQPRRARQAEWNVEMDVHAARRVFERWPSEVWVAPFELGAPVITGGAWPQPSRPSPVQRAYELHSPHGRMSWDLTAVWAAVCGEDELFGVSPPGTVTIDEMGASDFSRSGRHRVIRAIATPEAIARRFDELLYSTPAEPG